MPVTADAAIEISAFQWVPPFAQGQVRDLRVRWALEEAGLDYREMLLDAMDERPPDYYHLQPWGQVPIFREGDVTLFESGAIVLYIGERCPALLPPDPVARAKAMQWLIAALNSVEPMAMQLALIDISIANEPWAKQRRSEVVDVLDKRLSRLTDALGKRDWLESDFSAGDLLMATVLRIPPADMIARHPALAAYKARCEARPAFTCALDAQLAAFAAHTPEGERR